MSDLTKDTRCLILTTIDVANRNLDAWYLDRYITTLSTQHSQLYNTSSTQHYYLQNYYSTPLPYIPPWTQLSTNSYIKPTIIPYPKMLDKYSDIQSMYKSSCKYWKRAGKYSYNNIELNKHSQWIKKNLNKSNTSLDSNTNNKHIQKSKIEYKPWLEWYKHIISTITSNRITHIYIINDSYLLEIITRIYYLLESSTDKGYVMLARLLLSTSVTNICIPNNSTVSEIHLPINNILSNLNLQQITHLDIPHTTYIHPITTPHKLQTILHNFISHLSQQLQKYDEHTLDNEFMYTTYNLTYPIIIENIEIDNPDAICREVENILSYTIDSISDIIINNKEHEIYISRLVKHIDIQITLQWQIQNHRTILADTTTILSQQHIYKLYNWCLKKSNNFTSKTARHGHFKLSVNLGLSISNIIFTDSNINSTITSDPQTPYVLALMSLS